MLFFRLCVPPFGLLEDLKWHHGIDQVQYEDSVLNQELQTDWRHSYCWVNSAWSHSQFKMDILNDDPPIFNQISSEGIKLSCHVNFSKLIHVCILETCHFHQGGEKQVFLDLKRDGFSSWPPCFTSKLNGTLSAFTSVASSSNPFAFPHLQAQLFTPSTMFKVLC